MALLDFIIGPGAKKAKKGKGGLMDPLGLFSSQEMGSVSPEEAARLAQLTPEEAQARKKQQGLFRALLEERDSSLFGTLSQGQQRTPTGRRAPPRAPSPTPSSRVPRRGGAGGRDTGTRMQLL